MAGAGTFKSCIFWANPGFNDIHGTPWVTDSNVQGGFPGFGNIDDDPMFVSFSLPATIEGSVRSGFTAAQCVLQEEAEAARASRP